MVKRKKNGGFATAVSSVLALAIATTGLYVIKVQKEYKDIKVASELAKKTANRIKKIGMAVTTYKAVNNGTVPQSCQDLVSANLITPNDCKDALGNPIPLNVIVGKSGPSINIGVPMPQFGDSDFYKYYGRDVAEQVQKIDQEYQNNIGQQQNNIGQQMRDF